MKNCKKLLVGLLAASVLCMAVGCGRNTTEKKPKDHAVTEDQNRDEKGALQEEGTDRGNDTLSENRDNVIEDNNGAAENLGEAVGDVGEGVGDAVGDVGRGVGDAVEDTGDAVEDMMDGEDRTGEENRTTDQPSAEKPAP